MTAPLYRWPEAAKFGRVVPKTRFHERDAVKAAVRESFTADIRQITWAYKLADATIHLRGDATTPEIQVFTIEAKRDDVDERALAAIDVAIPFPIIFEIQRPANGAVQMVAAIKQLGGSKPRVGPYFRSGWHAADGVRSPLPMALDLAGLYAELLKPLLPIDVHPGEDLAAVTARVEDARRLQRELDRLEKRLRNEPQFNRKVELRRKVRHLREALDSSMSPPTQAKDDQWTS